MESQETKNLEQKETYKYPQASRSAIEADKIRHETIKDNI